MSTEIRRLYRWIGAMGCCQSDALSVPTPEPALTLEHQCYTREPSGVVRCSIGALQMPVNPVPICIRGKICCSGELFPVGELVEMLCNGSLWVIPSSIEVIQPYCLGASGIAFEQHSRLRQLRARPCYSAHLRSLCVPGSMESFVGCFSDLPRSLEVVTFASSVDSVEDTRSASQCFGRPIVMVAAGNRHFTLVGHSLMNFAGTSLIRRFSPANQPHPWAGELSSKVEELGDGCFRGNAMRTFKISAPSRLRLIGRMAFADCAFLAAIQIPSTVEVIGEAAFVNCRALQEVQIASGSQLRRIEARAFSECSFLQPVDVPSAARILGDFNVLARVYGEDGGKRIRVQFFTRVALC